MKRFFLIICLISIGFCQGAKPCPQLIANESSEGSFWDGVGLTFDDLEAWHSEIGCHHNPRSFLACVASVNRLHELSPGLARFAPGAGERGITLPAPDWDTLREKWISFHSSHGPISIGPHVRKIKSYIPKQKESMAVGRAINAGLKELDMHSYLEPAASADFWESPNVEGAALSFFPEADQTVAVLQIHFFHNFSLVDEVANALRELRRRKVTRLVLDLRNNRGGTIKVAMAVAGLFLGPNVKLGESISLMGTKVEKFTSTQTNLSEGISLVTVANATTVSSAEFLAGVLQYHERGPIIGSTTFGKGMVTSGYYTRDVEGFFQKFDLIHNSTSGMFVFPDGTSNQLYGVDPNYFASDLADGSTEGPRMTEFANAYPNHLGLRPELKRNTQVRQCLRNSANETRVFRLVPHDHLLRKAFDLHRCLGKAA